MKFNLLVIRTKQLELLKKQYELLGFQFSYHQHGKGPYHYASEEKDFVFEIYPLKKSISESNNLIRLGIEVEDLKAKIHTLKQSDWKILSEAKEMEWGNVALVQDLDRRKIELKEN